MKISYAQRLEDYHLDLVFQDVAAGTYIDVGGGHPVADNVSFHFYLKGWRGLVVEPQSALAKLYAGVRPRDITLETLVGRTAGVVEFHRVEGLHGFSTTVAENAKTASGYGAAIETVRMPMTTLAELVATHAMTRVDFLKIDVEGAEADVLAGLDWNVCRPRVVVVEAVAPGSMAPAWEAWEGDLLARGYRFAFFDELNRFYVADEAAALAERFPTKPAPWDAALHPWDFGRAPANTAHPDHALANTLVSGLMASLPTLDPAVLRHLVEAGLSSRKIEGGEAIREALLGTASHPGAQTGDVDLAGILDSDQFRAALGRVSAPYDGGFLMED